MVKGFGMLPNKSLQGKGFVHTKTLLAVVWRFFFIAAGKSGKFCRHGMCEIGRRFITALPPLHSLHETLYFHRAVTAKLSSAPGGVQVR